MKFLIKYFHVFCVELLLQHFLGSYVLRTTNNLRINVWSVVRACVGPATVERLLSGNVADFSSGISHFAGFIFSYKISRWIKKLLTLIGTHLISKDNPTAQCNLKHMADSCCRLSWVRTFKFWMKSSTYLIFYFYTGYICFLSDIFVSVIAHGVVEYKLTKKRQGQGSVCR